MLSKLRTVFVRPEKIEEERKVEALAKNTSRDILTISTVFPLDFFPDDLIIDALKVTHIHREFFFTEEITGILIENIRHVSVSSGPFFSTLMVVDNVFEPHTMVVKPLVKAEAKKALSILQGLLLSKREKIDTTQISYSSRQAIEEIGRPANLASI